MKEFVIAICIILIVLAVYIIIKTLIRLFKGKCCEGCKNCALKNQCDNNENKNNTENSDKK